MKKYIRWIPQEVFEILVLQTELKQCYRAPFLCFALSSIPFPQTSPYMCEGLELG